MQRYIIAAFLYTDIDGAGAEGLPGKRGRVEVERDSRKRAAIVPNATEPAADFSFNFG